MPASILDQFRSRGKLAAALREIRDDTSNLTLIPTRAHSMRLRPYQINGVTYLREHKKAILGDAPGLGKTFQALEAATLPAAITCPLSLVGQWEDFIRDQYPDDSVHIAAYGDVIKRHEAMEAFKADPKDNKWLIVNHDALRTFFLPDVQTVIADEMHHFRNREAKRSIGFKRLAARTPNVFGLTATPIFKDVGDIYHLLHVLDPQRWGSYWSFLATYAVTDQSRYGTKIVRAKSPAKLERDTQEFMLARTYKDVGLELPQRIDKQVVLTLEPEARKRYDMLRDYYRLELENDETGEAKNYFNAGAVLHALRQLTVTKEKIEAVKQIIDDTPGDEPVIVFCWYRETAKVVAKALDAAEITGALKPEDRRDLARGAEGQRVRVATMESLSEGVDLSDFRTVVYVEETYVPGQQYQSMSRVIRHRTSEGEATPVVVYWVRYKNTVDAVVHDTARSRIDGNAMTVLREALL
jgi:superfamily II DNA or RNA helicase